jgi:DNA-binding SARP family transcriptional activator
VQAIATIRLLGQFDFRVGGQALAPLESARAESLLAYLLLHRDAPQSRQRLAFLLWPDSTEAQARTNLRHVLHTLRRRLPDPDRYLEITPRTLRWRPEAPYWLDVAAFEGLLAPAGVDPAPGDGKDRRRALREAVEIYTGELLAGCYDEWLLADRDRLRHRQLDALAELAGLYEAGGDVVEAISYAERLLRGDPLREQTYRALMRLHDARGDRARALRVYHVCSSTLERELGVEPSAATQGAYAALLSRAPAPPTPAVPLTSAVPPPTVARAGGPPLVGRAPQRQRLAAAWRSTDAGHAQLVLVQGEPGVGKTRLVEDFRAWCARRGVATADARCYPAEGALAYGPVVAWLRSEALRPRLVRLGRPRLTEIARLLPELLEELPDLERPEPLPESDLRHRLFDAVAGAILAAGGPVLLVADDLQHGDRETCQLLHYLLRAVPAARLLVVATARREDVDGDHPLHHLLAGLRARDRLEEIELTRLSPADTAALAERLTGAPLTGPDAQRLYDETEGNPLFVVEALRAGWTSGQLLSPRVQSVIETRLAQLGPAARDLVEVAATIGREFSTDVLAAAADFGADTLVRSLDELWRRRIVREQGADTYDFSHDKIRQVAYLGLGAARRRRLHLRIATALERASAAGGGPVSAQVAAHYERAGAGEQAISWYRRAAEASQLLHANAQALHLLDRALGVLRSLPESANRDAVELAVQTARLAPLVSVETYASAAMTATQQRAQELAQAYGVNPSPPLLRSLALTALTEANFAEATRYGQLLQDAGRCGADDVLVVEAAYVLGIAAFWQADFDTARRHFELAVKRYRPEDRTAHLIHYAQDPKVVCLGRLAITLWFLGQPEAARRARSAALAWADAIGHPFSRVLALTFAAVLALDMGEEQALRDYAAELVSAQEWAVNQRVTAAFHGYVAVLDGDPDHGIAAIRDAVQHTSIRPGAPGEQAILGRILLAACVSAGDDAAAVAAADRLLAMGGAACVWEPEALRVRAELAPQRT